MVQELLAGFFLLGSFSIGYALLRIGFPEKQIDSNISKIIFSYLIGATIISISLATSVVLGEAFLPAAILIYFSIGITIALAISNLIQKDYIEIENEIDNKKKKNEIKKENLNKTISQKKEEVNIREVIKKYKSQEKQVFKEEKTNNLQEEKNNLMNKLKNIAKEKFGKKEKNIEDELKELEGEEFEELK